MWSHTLQQAPRSGQFAMPPNPRMYAGALLAAGAETLGYHPYPYPMAVNSVAFDGRPRCNSCGFCAGFGCPINARGGAAVSFLHHALRCGAELRSRCFVHRVDMASPSRAAGVSYIDEAGQSHHLSADIVVLAASAVETPRLMLLSATCDHPDGIGNRSGQLGRNLMWHFFTIGFGYFPEVDVHGQWGPTTTVTIDDFVGPDTPSEATSAGLPYIKGGICETGGSIALMTEALFWAAIFRSGGTAHKGAMNNSPLRSHVSGLTMIGEDMPQLQNLVDLDPDIRDMHGFPVPRITHSNHPFEHVASQYYGQKLAAVCGAAPGAELAGYVPAGALTDLTGQGSPAAQLAPTNHVMGTARMGDDPATSVVDKWQRVHEVDNLYVADGSVFVSAGGFNPTNTIMALALRVARNIADALPG
jgi:choline dehydrogenase-like flavoprotein